MIASNIINLQKIIFTKRRISQAVILDRIFQQDIYDVLELNWISM